MKSSIADSDRAYMALLLCVVFSLRINEIIKLQYTPNNRH